VLASNYISRGDQQKARQTLETLLHLWKDADPNLPLLKQARAEFAKL
jgi:eukaryotic-like serine/threonine-protein kinase